MLLKNLCRNQILLVHGGMIIVVLSCRRHVRDTVSSRLHTCLVIGLVLVLMACVFFSRDLDPDFDTSTRLA